MYNAGCPGVERLCRFRFIFGVALVLFAAPRFAAADFGIPPPPLTPSSNTHATHAGRTIANESPRMVSFVAPTVSGVEMNTVNASWTIETGPWSIFTDVDAGHMVWAIFRGTESEGLDGKPQEGINYAFVHHGLNTEATTTLTADFNLPLFGDADTPSGTYTIVIARIPDTKFVATNVVEVREDGSQVVEGFDAPYTDQDFINWFAKIDTNGTAPGAVRTLEFEYIAGEAHVPCTEDCFSNVLFLPGIESSRLYRPQVVGAEEDKLWEPLGDEDVQALFLKSDGTSVNPDIYAKEGDVVDELPIIGSNIYKSFIAKMDDLKTQGLINDWEAAAYDWRLSLDDILASGNQTGTKISYLESTSTPYIIQELKKLASTSKSGKVTVIAHSNGGLVAKRLTEKLGTEASTLIDKIILVAVPQAGTPDAVSIAMHGEAFGPFGVVASKAVVRAFASTSPMLYHLLPSARYFTQVDDPVIAFDPSLPEWIAKYGDVIHSEESLHAFLTDSFGRADAETDDTNQPVQLSDSLLTSAETLHDDLDNWTPPTGVELIQIAGWGVPSNSGITYKKKGEVINPEPTFTIDGDGRVPVPSALWTSVDSGATNYWVDLSDFNNSHLFRFGPLAIDHASILEIDELRNFLGDVIKENVQSLSSYKYIFTESPPSTETRLQFALHSPLTLDIYDDLGNHTGVSTTTGQIEENIPGTYYIQFGDVKYIFADSGALQHIVMSGYDTGTFTFEIGELLGDTVVGSTTFTDVPVTPETKVRFDVSSGIDSASDLSVDENGDGTVDSSYASSTGQRIVPAEPVASPSRGGGGNGPPVGISAPSADVPSASSTIATSTVASSTEEAYIPKQEIATSPAPFISDIQSRKIAQATIKTAVKRNLIVATTSTGNKPERSLQVASAAQATTTGLWSRIYHWAINMMGIIIK